MPDVQKELDRAYFDTAATSLLYRPEIYARVCDLVGADRILFGSDFPLVSQERALQELNEAPVDDDARALILGENARRLLRL